MLCCRQPVRLEVCCCYVTAQATLLASISSRQHAIEIRHRQ